MAIDSTCMLWQRLSCNHNGVCIVYNMNTYSFYQHGLTAWFKVLAFAFSLIIAYKVHFGTAAQEKREEAPPVPEVGVANPDVPAVVVYEVKSPSDVTPSDDGDRSYREVPVD